ncbi:hypothetical protein [Saccharopolyspora taberi]|uniref:Uncharacterized protein n=1 Tax=Saccharopolyspora taberi TaxID=60895 RepID=A0ABN3VBY7_9PSEU
MQDPDEWQAKGVHWHVFAEPRDGCAGPGSRRRDRLRQTPLAVLRTPEEVTDWIAGMVREHADRRHVRLIGPRGGVGQVGDDGHIEHDVHQNLDVVCRGDSLYVDIARENDRLQLWAEAVTADECPDGTHDQDAASAQLG